MSEFTPTLSHFRAVYGAMCADWCRDGSLAEFDRMIAKVKSDAWDEGHKAGYARHVAVMMRKPVSNAPENPHRIEGEA